MKQFLIFLVASVFANSAQAIEANFSATAYLSKSGEPFVEVYSAIKTASLIHEAGKPASLTATVLFLNEKEELVKGDKFQVELPTTATTYIDCQKYALPVGKYMLKVTFTDNAQATNTISLLQRVVVAKTEEPAQLSGIELSQNIVRGGQTTHPFYKYGLTVEPRVSKTFLNTDDKLLYYLELYTRDMLQDSILNVRSTVANVLSPNKVEVITNNSITKKALRVILQEVPIPELLTGNYMLTVELHGRMGQILATQQLLFKKENPYVGLTPAALAEIPLNETFVSRLSPDTLDWSISALTPRLGNDIENINSLLKKGSIEEKQRYLFLFWAKEYPHNPLSRYITYMREVLHTDDNFKSTSLPGHLTDRGYVYLKYGKPTRVIEQESEPNAPPYEIWAYNSSNGRAINGELKFLFYNPNLTANDYELLHSTARGERQDRQWRRKLYRNTPSEDPVDGVNVDKTYGNKADDYFNE